MWWRGEDEEGGRDRGLAEIVVSSINDGRQNSDGRAAPLIYDQTESTVLLSDYKYSHTPCVKHTDTHMDACANTHPHAHAH